MRHNLRINLSQIFSALVLFAVPAFQAAYAVDYFDDFERPDNVTLGDGWLEKAPGAFSLGTGMALKNGVATGYRDNVVYRPASEDLLDAEASIELDITNTSVGYPQIFVRLQSDTVGLEAVLDGYILYMDNNPGRARLGRQVGNNFVQQLAVMYLSSPLNTTDRYRMRLRAVGTDPVLIDAWVERAGAGGQWEIIGQASASDSAANRIDTPGAVGFGGYVESSYVYDNFNRLDLEVGEPGAPIPSTSALVPNQVDEGSADFILTVSGSDFSSNAIVRWNGEDRPTTFLSETDVQATISTVDVSTAGSASVTVFNPAPGGGESNPQTLTIEALQGNPVPTLSSINPDTAERGGTGFVLTVQGAGFIPESVVRMSDADRQTAYISATELQAVVLEGDIATAGTMPVTVFNSGPGGGSSNAMNFVVTDPVSNPVPILSSINPDSIVAGSGQFTLVADGLGFVPESIIYWNSTARPTIFVSDTRLTAIVDAEDVAASGSANVEVVTPAPGGGSSAVQTFDILPAGGGGGDSQSLTGISPQYVEVNTGDLQLTVDGSGYTSNSIVQIDGLATATTYVSGGQLIADIDAELLSSGLRSAVTVRTPDASNVVTAPQPLFVLQPGEVLMFDNFDRPDSPNIGNNWTEKSPDVFSLQDGQVSGIATPTRGFNHVITYRPIEEDAQNIEVGMEFVRPPGSASLYPQVHARVQRGNLEEVDGLSSYTLFLDTFSPPGLLQITPIANYFECYIAIWELTSPFVEGDRYRLRFRVSGSDPVEMTGYLDRLNVDYWEVVGSGSVLHDENSPPAPGGYCNNGGMIPPIVQSGGTGFAKWREASDSYDNFYAVRLAESDNPAPGTSGLSPSAVQAGSPALTLSVDGSNFLPSSVVRWNGSDRTTVFVSSTELQATISDSDIASSGTAAVTVFNPAPGGGLSNSQSFEILPEATNPVPVVTTTLPSTVAVDSAGFTLVVQGSGFVPDSVVRWNGEARPTSFDSADQLQAAIDAADIAVAGSASITVFSPAPGGGVSNEISLTILDSSAGYYDEFARPDNASLGNGWVEKQPGAFSIANEVVIKNQVASGYVNNITYRPAQENLLDTEASVEFRLTGGSIGYPQVFTRVQTDTAATDGMLDGYILYVSNSANQAVLGRQRGSAFVQGLATLYFTAALVQDDQYRLRLRAVGSDPVVLDAFVERLGPDGWEIIGAASGNDGAANRIGTAGSSGFGGYIEDGYEYDNFLLINMSGTSGNP